MSPSLKQSFDALAITKDGENYIELSAPYPPKQEHRYRGIPIMAVHKIFDKKIKFEDFENIFQHYQESQQKLEHFMNEEKTVRLDISDTSKTLAVIKKYYPTVSDKNILKCIDLTNLYKDSDVCGNLRVYDPNNKDTAMGIDELNDCFLLLNILENKKMNLFKKLALFYQNSTIYQKIKASFKIHFNFNPVESIEPFKISYEWQTLPSQMTSVPPGLEIKMNITTGKKEIRIPSKFQKEIEIKTSGETTLKRIWIDKRKPIKNIMPGYRIYKKNGSEISQLDPEQIVRESEVFWLDLFARKSKTQFLRNKLNL